MVIDYHVMVIDYHHCVLSTVVPYKHIKLAV